MGPPKFLLDFAGEPLLAYIARTVGSLFMDVVVVTAAEYELPSLPVLIMRDELPFQGSVDRIVYEIHAAAGAVRVVISCEAPFSNSASIQMLFAALGDADITVHFGRIGKSRSTQCIAAPCCHSCSNNWMADDFGRRLCAMMLRHGLFPKRNCAQSIQRVECYRHQHVRRLSNRIVLLAKPIPVQFDKHCIASLGYLLR